MRTDACAETHLEPDARRFAGAAGETGLAAVLATSWFASAAGAAVVPEGAVVAPPAAPEIAEGRGARGGETGISESSPYAASSFASSFDVCTTAGARTDAALASLVALGGAGGTAAGFAGRSSSASGAGASAAARSPLNPKVSSWGTAPRSVASLIAI